MRVTIIRQASSSDVTDKQWELLEPLIPLPSLEGMPPAYERREIVNAILYVLRAAALETAASRFASLGHRLLVLSTLAGRWHLGSSLSHPAYGGAH